jgi:aldehyde dehydrogenase
MDTLVQRPNFKAKYDNYIGGKFIPPVSGEYFDVVSPIDGKVFTKAAHSTKGDLDLAVDAAYEAFKTWGKTSSTERSVLLNKIAQVMEDNLEYIAAVETVDNGKPVRETLAADIPLAIDHFRYFASVIRAEESSISELDSHSIHCIK